MSSEHSKADASKYVRLDNEEGVKEIIVGSVFGLWDIVNNLTRLRPSHRKFYRVSIFGSARAKEGSFVYEEVKKLAAALTAIGCDIITGGGPGLMQAANEGAVSGDTDDSQRSVGIRITLPFEQKINEYVEKGYEHQTFFTRLHHFTLASDAFIVVPGGIGTVLETFMVWQLLQVGHLPKMPLILMGDMYKGMVEWAAQSMLEGPIKLVNPEDMQIPTCTNSIDEAVSIIKKHREEWLKQQGQGA